MLKRYHDTTTRNTSGNRLIACCFYRSWLCNNVSKATLLNFKGTVSYSSNSSGHAVYLNDFVSDHSSLQFPTSSTISDHIIKTLNHNKTNEDSSNPGGDEIFSFIVDAESNLTHPKLKELFCAQTASLTATMKTEQAILSTTIKQILRRSVMTMSRFSTSQVCQDLEQSL